MKLTTLILLTLLTACGPLPTKTEPAPEAPTVPTPPVEPAPTPEPEPDLSIEPVYPGKTVKVGGKEAYKTLAEAYAAVRPSNIGAILLARGETFDGGIPGKYTMPTLAIDAFGDLSKPMPVIKIGSSVLLFKETKATLGSLTIKNVVVDKGGARGMWLKWLDGGSMHIENGEFEGQIVIQHYQAEHPKNVVIRSSVLRDAWNIAGQSHAQCLYASHVEGLLVEGNTFSHCGWKKQAVIPGQGANDEATVYNHALYISESNDVVIRENKIFDSSSMGIKFRSDVVGGSKNILVEKNHFKHGDIGIGCGGNTAPLADRFQNVRIISNVFEAVGATKPTNRAMSWNVDILGVSSGLIQDNVFKNVPNYSNKFLVRVDAASKHIVNSGNIEQ